MLEELFSQLAAWGYKGCAVPIRYLSDLQKEIEKKLNQNLIDKELYQSYLTEFNYSPPNSLTKATSIILVAVPEPKVQLTFTLNGESVKLIVPPTYGERKKERRTRERLKQILEPAGYKIAEANIPKKLLAVRCGLATYGKNNITYVPGMGSFYSLTAACSDIPATEGDLQESKMMERCQNCSACVKHCPTKAISSDRFLLYAERCITFHNEKPGNVPFPAWIDPSWHNCLVGCLHCQRVCPENRQVWKWVEEGAEFSKEETDLLLEKPQFDDLPAITAKKLEQHDLESFVGIIPRNLNALIGKHR